MEDKSKTNKVIAGIVIVVLLALGVYLIAKRSGNGGTASVYSTPTPSAMQAGNDQNRVVVGDQMPGAVIYVDTVTLAKPGWIAIHADNNGAPGKIIGVSYMKAGTNPASVNLTTNTVLGQNYYVMLHNDDGDGVFNESVDTPLLDDAGQPIMVKIKAATQFDVVKG